MGGGSTPPVAVNLPGGLNGRVRTPGTAVMGFDPTAPAFRVSAGGPVIW